MEGQGGRLQIHKSELCVPTTLCMDGWFSAQSSLVKADPSFVLFVLCRVASLWIGLWTQGDCKKHENVRFSVTIGHDNSHSSLKRTEA